MSARTRRLLAVEDEPADALLLQEALNRAPGCERCRLSVAASIEEARQALERPPGGAGADLLLLDLRLGPESGFDLLAWLRRHERLRVLPVVVLTTSYAEADVRRAYELGANAYAVKPSSFEELARLLSALAAFWFDFVMLPSSGE